jgi:hypothetical protein
MHAAPNCADTAAQAAPTLHPAAPIAPATLHQYLQAWRHFDYQQANCAHFALGWAAPAALLGVPMPQAPAQLRQTLRALGAASLRQAVGARLGNEIAPTLSQPGDVLLYGGTLALCDGRHAILPADSGALVALPVAGAVCGWRHHRSAP